MLFHTGTRPLLSTLALAGLAVASLEGVSRADADTAKAGLEVVAERYLAELLAPSFAKAEEYMASLGTDGAWDDIDYDTGEVVYEHISRCSAMLAAWRRAGHEYEGDAGMLEAGLRSFHYWMQEDWQDWNWWDNQIGATRQAAHLMLIGRGQIPEPDWAKGLEILGRAWPAPNNPTGYGQNLVYRVNQTLIRGILEDDPGLVQAVVQRTAEEIRRPAPEGIQIDWSFHQHGHQLYWGGYGQGFVSDLANIALKVAGTPYALPPEKLDLIAGLVLDGGVTGRGVARRHHSRAGQAFAAVCDHLVKAGNPRRAELTAMAGRIRGDEAVPPLIGNRHFFTSDFMAHHRPGFYTSFKMASLRVFGTESGNGEGLRNYHLPDGAAWLYRRGDEYTDIYPVLDWKRLPGITCEQGPDPIPLCDWGWGSASDTTWAGGASDGMSGTACFELKRLNVRTLKAAFFFDDAFVLLGTAVSCTGPDPVYTSVNQCLLRGEVTVCAGDRVAVLPTGEAITYERPEWIHHDGVGYVPLIAGSMTARAGAQTGSWQDINRSYSPEPVTVDVFSLWIDHGAEPADGSYAYAVIPGTDPSALARWAAAPPVEVLANTATLQAVADRGSGVVGAVFLEPGNLRLGPDTSVSVDQPCVTVIREGGAEFRAAVANPRNEPLEVEMHVSRRLSGPGAVWDADQGVTRLTFALPAGPEAGKSVVRVCAE
jgi:chondroitin AC lyase